MSPIDNGPGLLFGGGGIGDEIPTLEEVQELLTVLKQRGVSRIDTAALYPPLNIGASETLLGQAGAAEQGFIIDTKILALGLEADGTLEPSAIEKSLNTSYDRLNLKGGTVNLLCCHAVDHTTPLENQLAALDTQYKKGRFKKLGVVNYPMNLMSDIMDICQREGYVKPTVYIGRYNVLCREIEEMLPILRGYGMTVDAHSAVGGGFLSGRLTAGDVEGTRFSPGNIMGAHARQQYDHKEMHDAIQALSGILEPAGIGLAEGAVRWLFYHSKLESEDGMIVSGSSIAQVVQNLDAIRRGPLPASIVEAMSGIKVSIGT
ncbi:Aldo/keto reductase [Xylariaceae sp. FL0255]|nr:Aldo/keto reductase [Xylariaceae sp. FL0255]